MQNPGENAKYPIKEDNRVRARAPKLERLNNKKTKDRSAQMDITERKQVEEALREREARLQVLFETMAEGVVLIAPDGQIVQANPAAERILGLQRSLTEGRDYISSQWEILRVDGTPMPPEEMAGPRAMKEKRLVRDVVMGVKRPDGFIFWIDVSAAPLMDETGKLTGVVGTFTDITELERAEEVMRESAEKYRTIFDSSTDMMCIQDIGTGEVLDVNEVTLEKCGCTKSEFLKKGIIEFTPKDPRYTQEKIVEKVRQAAAGEKQIFEWAMIDKEGKIRDTEVRLKCIKIEGKDRLLAVVRDITERKKAEEQLLKYQAKLKAMASQLSSIQESQRHELAIALHDRITQRLAITKLSLEAASVSFKDADAAKKIRGIAKQVGGTMEDAYSLMLELSNPVLYEIGLEAALGTLLQSDLVKSSGIKCRLVAPREKIMIETDIRVALYQATRELLVNAIKYSKAKQIEVHLSRTQDGIVVRVKDDGIGFDPSVVKRPGKRGGFGLFNIRENIGGIAGKFTIESETGKGTFAKVWVPRPQEGASTEKGGSDENTHRR